MTVSELSENPKMSIESANPLIARLCGAFVRGLESLSLRGGPTLFRLLSTVPGLSQMMATTRLAGGELITFPAFDAYWCRYVWANAPYERDVEQIFRKIGKNRVLVDCGANIGYWSIRACGLGFSKVIAIEANRDLIEILRENFRMNGVSGTVHHAAVYARSGEDLFLDHTDSHAQAGLGDRGMPITSLSVADAVKDLSAGTELVVKLDVEGAEIPALEGAEGVENAIFVYEDFPRCDMVVTRYLLDKGMAVFGVAPTGAHREIKTVEDAFVFNAQTAIRGAPSNLVACRAEQGFQMNRELSQEAAR